MSTLYDILHWVLVCFGALPILTFVVYVTFTFVIPQPDVMRTE